jgi:23S rRNA pseudouridine2605 synthase
MRINKFIAQATGLSRRAADKLIISGRVQVNGQLPTTGGSVRENDQVLLDGQALRLSEPTLTVLLHKPAGYVVSRQGQGSRTIYELLPAELHHLKPVGRLDKNSSGLLLLTNDGQLANELTHPRYGKQKTYEVKLDKPLAPLHQQLVTGHGVLLEDGPSKFMVGRLTAVPNGYEVRIGEGRNRQIRRTFAALGYGVIQLHRTQFGQYVLASSLKPGQFEYIRPA